MKLFTKHLDYNLIVKMMKTKIKKQQNKDIGSKPPNVFHYLKGISQEAKDLMIGLEDAEDDLDKEKLIFVGSNGEKFNFNTFKTPLYFLLNIYHGKIILKEAQFLQKSLNKEIKRLKFDYKPNNVEGKEEINSVLTEANELLNYMDIIINAFKHGTFLSENLKKESKDAPNNFVLEDVSKFIKKIESMSKNINPSLFNEFF